MQNKTEISLNLDLSKFKKSLQDASTLGQAFIIDFNKISAGIKVTAETSELEKKIESIPVAMNCQSDFCFLVKAKTSLLTA